MRAQAGTKVYEDGQGGSVEWYTPPYVFEAIGLEFDVDPASPPGGVSWIPARRFIDETENGLITPWEGRVWLNPPFGRSHVDLWMDKMIAHRNGIALVASRTASGWWQRAARSAEGVLFLERKIRYVRMDGSDPGVAMYGSTAMAWGDECVEALRRSNLGWMP